VTINPGQVWRDNYDYNADYARFVKVLAVRTDDVLIRRCTKDGEEIPRSPSRFTKKSRFNGGRSGFTLVKEAS